MRELIYAIMDNYPNIVIFLHVVTASVWVGGMAALHFLTRAASKDTQVDRRFASRAGLFKKFFIALIPFISVSLLTSILMGLGYREEAMDAEGFILDSSKFEAYKYINAKFIIWIVMVMNMILMTWILSKANCRLCKPQKQSDCMWLVSEHLLPINILLGLIAIYIGVSIRSLY
ncbi:hypothetical protein GJV85_12055 [Sulfurimonas aquatica]|uniref:Copper resistance protein D domain-containing protein n=1 Tax=Sulfurimonas aquatica TaxID=2672570 RepID=A0A975GDK2_9BACT|nr:hypothetical protein [Sulfurimonas aquatica]QSZ42816.1 hypothetical protein GJV85_12055 [Sulfurimonas aquatica]